MYWHVSTSVSHVQVVVAGCGGDCRAYRLALPPHITVFHLDFPPVIAYRARVLAGAAPRCTVVDVSCDLSQPTWPAVLVGSGYDASSPALWVLEGVLPYLTPGQISLFLEAIGSLCCAGSRLTGDVQNTHYQSAPSTAAFRAVWAEYGAPFVSGTDDPAARVAEYGFTTCHVVQQPEYAVLHGYALPEALQLVRSHQPTAPLPRSLFFTAIKP